MSKNQGMYSLILKCASIFNILALFFPWWSEFEITQRLHSDAFLFGFLSYHTDPPPVLLILPSESTAYSFQFWPLPYEALMVALVVGICLSSFFYLQASLKEASFLKGLVGFLLSVIALVTFVASTILYRGYGSFIGAVASPSWRDWGPDVGFFIILFSITLGLIGLISNASRIGLRICLRIKK